MKKLTTLFTLFLVFFSTVTGYSLEEGDEAGKFVNPDLQGKFVLSKSLIGKGWVILDFFATDCEGCKKELPELEELYEEFEEYEFKIIVFSVDEEGAEIVKPYFKENPTKLIVVLDRFKVAAQKYGVDEIPAVFLINPEKEIVFKRIAYSEETVKEIRKILADTFIPEESEQGS